MKLLGRLALVVLLLGCRGGADATPPSDASPEVADVQPEACPPTHDADGPACAPRLDSSCAVHEVALLGGGCAAVGVPAATAAMDLDGRGGAREILPTAACPAGELAYPGLRACEPIAPCGDDRWGGVADAPGTIHVDGAHVGESDGSRGKPFTTIGAALARVEAGGTVVIAAGAYVEDVAINKAVRVVGRCPSMVTITGASTVESAAAALITANATLERVAVTGPAHGVVVEGASATLASLYVHGASVRTGVWFRKSADGVLRRSVIDGVTNHGVAISGSRARVEQCLVRGVREGTVNGGVRVNPDPETLAEAEGTVVASWLDKNDYVGAQVIASKLTIEDSVISESAPTSGTWGVGAIASYLPAAKRGSELTLRGSIIRGNSYMGVLARTSKLLVERSVVRDTRVQPTGDSNGRGIVVQSLYGPAELTVRDALVSGNRETGVSINGDVVARIERTIVRDTIADSTSNGTGVFGELFMKATPRVTIERSLLANNPFAGAAIAGTLELRASRLWSNGTHAIVARGGSVNVVGTLIHAQRPAANNGDGHGILAYPDPGRADPSVTIEDSRIDGASKAGIGCFGGPLRVVRTTVRDVVPERSTGNAGLCVVLERETDVVEPRGEIERSVFEACHAAGVVIAGADATLRSSVVRGIKPLANGEYGDGVLVSGVNFTIVGVKPSRAEITDCLIERSARAGVAVFGSSASLARSLVRCNALALDVEPIGGFDGSGWVEHPFSLEDGGGNVCGCDAAERCVAQSNDLRPIDVSR